MNDALDDLFQTIDEVIPQFSCDDWHTKRALLRDAAMLYARRKTREARKSISDIFSLNLDVTIPED